MTQRKLLIFLFTSNELSELMKVGSLKHYTFFLKEKSLKQDSTRLLKKLRNSNTKILRPKEVYKFAYNYTFHVAQRIWKLSFDIFESKSIMHKVYRSDKCIVLGSIYTDFVLTSPTYPTLVNLVNPLEILNDTQTLIYIVPLS